MALKHNYRYYLSALAFSGLLGCFQAKPGDVAGGGGIETTDGEILASAGMRQGARVRLVPEGFNPLVADSFPQALTSITDATGRYALKGVPAGRYNLEAWQPKDGTRLFLPDQIIVTSESRTLPSAGLARTGRLRLNWEGGRHGHLFVPGTTILHRILPDEIEAPALVLVSLPQGMLPPVFWSESKSDTAGTRITDSVAIQPDSVSEWTVFAAWAHHGIWKINTTPTGAGTDTRVTSFPMLVRLSSPGFDFGQAAADGRDIRFSNLDGTELKYQVERWDAGAGKAEMWVRVPVVEGNSSRNSFRMHWGNPQADTHSSGPAVFGSGNNFAAVLHLGETGSAVAGGYADATGSGRTGTGVALDAAATATAVVGMGQDLNGATQWIRVSGNFPAGNAARSLSAWGKTENPTVGSHLADYGSDANYAAFGAWNDQGAWTVWHWGSNSDYRTSATADSLWRHITVDYDGMTSRFYVDGVLIGGAPRALVTTATGFTLGASYKGDDLWPGIIDEVTVSTVSRSPDWIKLLFETQRPDSKALGFEILE